MAPEPYVLKKMLKQGSKMPEFTAKSLAVKVKTDQKRIADLLVYYNQKRANFFKRLPIKEGKFYRYRVTEHGINYLKTMERKE